MNRDTIVHVSYQAAFNHIPVSVPQEIREELIRKIGKETGATRTFFKEDGYGFEKKADTDEILRGNFFPNQIILLHDYPSQLESAKAFAETAKTVLLPALDTLQIPVILQQIYIVRIHARPYGTDDARVFIGEQVLRLDGERTALFARPIQGVGFRFMFPMVNDTPYSFEVRVESVPDNNKLLVLENHCQYGEPLSPQAIREGEIERRLNLSIEFLHENAVAFLEKFNEPGD
ncbi:MAG TPA: hypothetical protein PKL97_01915 [Candidatus Omnitrophota bacterium]|nr:hypothetical protein [Candidatus Omnitrophota bacterium]